MKASIFAVLCLIVVVGFQKADGAGLPGFVIKTDDKGTNVAYTPWNKTDLAIIEILDADATRCLKIIYAGPLKDTFKFKLETSSEVPAGRYCLRALEGVSFAPEANEGFKKIQWTNPVDVHLAGDHVYVWDSGLPAHEGDTSPEEAKAFIYRFSRDGTLDASYGNGGRIGPILGPKDNVAQETRYRTIRAIAVDSREQLYIGNIYHEALVFDSNGKKLDRTVGGWDNDPRGPQCTGWVNSIAIGYRDHLYFASSGYQTLKVYDPSKDKFDGILYHGELPKYGGKDRMITATPDGAVYVIGGDGSCQRFNDTGSSLVTAYCSADKLKGDKPTGPCTTAGLIWMAGHDSGCLLLLWDDGEKIELVKSWGTSGKSAAKFELGNPSAVATTPDHMEFWITEDGELDDNSPAGNARVRKFRMNCTKIFKEAVEIK
jgi:hypothetical protein